MNNLGYIVTGILGVILIFLLVQWALEFKLNTQLRAYQKKNNYITRKTWHFTLKRSFTVLLTTGLLSFSLVSGVFDQSYTLNDRLLVNAQPVLTQAKLKSLIEKQNSGSFWDLFQIRTAESDFQAPEANMGEDQATQRDYLDTNVQVQGVQEGDIVKTNGNTIYYAARYHNKIRVIDVGNDQLVTLKNDIDLGDFSVDGLYLYDDYLVIIGYTFQSYSAPNEGGEFRDYYPGFYTVYTGTVIILETTSLEEVYRFETDTYFHDHRMIDDVLFLVSKKSLYDAELRPMLKQTINNETTTSYLGYDRIYYFDQIPLYSMTVLTSLKLETMTLKSQAFLSDVSHIYVNKDAIYTAFNYYKQADDSYEALVQIIKYDLNVDLGEINYSGQKIIKGHVHNQFWMDEDNGYFRVVTSQWSPILNRMYILKPNAETDEMDIISTVDEGLGKPNETVMSVRFNKDLVYIVTFEQIDPLYTIDLSDPANPVFIGEIEMPGFSSYLHPWLENHQVIGFGFDGDLTGMITGLKISAFDTRLDVPLHEYVLGQEDDDSYSYSFSEAHYNHKAMLISADKGLVAFPVLTYTYSNAPLYRYEYKSQYYIFMIDFSKEQVISDPIIINHDVSEYYYPVERGVYIDGVIYTFSYQQVISYHLENNEILQNVKFSS
jgi:inhibitor of cysteine peptidase